MFGKKKDAEEKAPQLSRKARRQMRKIEKKADRQAARAGKKAQKKAQKKIDKLHAATDKKLQKKKAKKQNREASLTGAAQNMSTTDLNKMADNVVTDSAKVSPAAGNAAKKTAKAQPSRFTLRKIQKCGGKTTQIIALLAPTLIPLMYAGAGVLVTAMKARKA